MRRNFRHLYVDNMHVEGLYMFSTYKQGMFRTSERAGRGRCLCPEAIAKALAARRGCPVAVVGADVYKRQIHPFLRKKTSMPAVMAKDTRMTT